MPHYCPSAALASSIKSVRFLLAGSVALLLAGSLSACSGRVDTGGMNLSRVEKGEGLQVAGGKEVSTSQVDASGSFKFDMAAEEQVATQSVAAWRKALAGDEKGAVAQLEALEKRFPQVLTIQMMLGQVKDHFGKKEEALEHFRRAARGNQFSTMASYKLAEALRETGRHDEAIPHYRRLIKGATNYDVSLREPFDFGLAYCLLRKDPHSQEGLKLLDDCLKARPDHKDALALKAELAGKH